MISQPQSVNLWRDIFVWGCAHNPLFIDGAMITRQPAPKPSAIMEVAKLSANPNPILLKVLKAQGATNIIPNGNLSRGSIS